ncbi:hypothetical protein PN479_07165 [Microcystis aeruginosa CS-573]|nr:hypothetical protein [Microcystis aeruginosa]MDB9395179.1 hypothetical protein [Microcystis aeruginosa CS-573]
MSRPQYTFTNYFENDVLTKRPYLKKEWCIYVIENPIRCEPQEDNRFRFWAQIKEFGDQYLRVITLEDKLTIHNAFPAAILILKTKEDKVLYVNKRTSV